MTQKEFFNRIEDMGIDLKALYIIIDRCTGRSGAHGVYEKDGLWIYYYADDRNHIDEEIIGTEEKAFDKMFQDVFLDLDLEEYIHRPITEDIVKIDKQTVCQFICKTYSMSEQKANDMWNNLKWDMHVLFEFKYYVANNQFVPDKFCYKVKGYSAEQLYKTTNLTPLGTYNYLIYLRKKPEEALANLKVQEIEELKPYQEQLQRLYSQGMSYWQGVKKSYVGKIDRKRFFNEPGRIVNTFGYYQDDDNTWFAFVTDEERGLQDWREKVPSEAAAIMHLIELSQDFYYSNYYHTVMDNFEDAGKLIINHIKQKYDYSEDKAQKALAYLLQVKPVAFEYFYLLKHGKYIPDKYAENYSGYTAKRLKQETSLTELGAFNYMVYLKRKPEEALANLKKGLPRRRLLSPQDVEELKKYMD